MRNVDNEDVCSRRDDRDDLGHLNDGVELYDAILVRRVCVAVIVCALLVIGASVTL